MTRLERAVAAAVDALSQWACAAAVAEVTDPDDAAWQHVLAARHSTRRRRTERTAAGTAAAPPPSPASTATATGTDTAPAPTPPPPPASTATGTGTAAARGASVDQVTEVSAELLAGLPPTATAQDTEPVVTALHYALTCAKEGDGNSAAEHLQEARIFAEEAGRRIRLRAEALEQAAAQLEFLTTEVPADVEPRPPAEDVVEALRRAVEEGRPPGATDRERARAAVDERLEHLERRYVECGAAHFLAALSEERTEWHRSGADSACTEYVPPGWEPDHWITITVHPDGIDLTTHRAGAPSKLDDERCAQAKEWAADFERALSRMGLACDLRFHSDVVAPAGPERSAADGSHAQDGDRRPGRRTRDDLRRQDGGPRHRRIDDPDDRR